MTPCSRKMIGAFLAVLAAGGGTVRAGDRAFAYSYDTEVMQKGGWEYEQWLTWKTNRRNEDSSFDRWDVRHEIEYGLTDRLQTAAYYDWRYQDGESVGNDRARFRDVALETVYQLTDPDEAAFGSALYSEVKWGDELFELEGKLLLQKNLGDWTLVWNGIAAAEWEGKNYDEDKGEFGQTAGAAFRFNDHVSLGAEAVHEVEYEGWEEWGDHVVYAGPTLAVRAGRGALTLSPLAQVSDVDGEPDYQTRLIAQFMF